MGLIGLRKVMFPEEFVIDEPLESVYEPKTTDEPEPTTTLPEDSTLATDREETSLDIAEAELTLETSTAATRSGDLLSQMSQLLIEQVRLSERAHQAERTQAHNNEIDRLIRQSLPFLDNFNHLLVMAREHPPSEELNNWLRNVEALYYRITSLYEEFGLKFINSVGKPVDLNYHEVVEYRTTTKHPHHTVIKELQKGAVLKDRLLRDARVIVARNPRQEPHKT